MSNGSKILNWKQITTRTHQWFPVTGCVQWFKDTKLKANHNSNRLIKQIRSVVSNGSKILNWKQITTVSPKVGRGHSCVQWFKDTKLKANHNLSLIRTSNAKVVSNGSKILNWKQITTCDGWQCRDHRCVQWFKDTKLKANHNHPLACFFLRFVVSNGSKILNWKQITTESFALYRLAQLCPMVQRY